MTVIIPFTPPRALSPEPFATVKFGDIECAMWTEIDKAKERL